jgi:hypothetical protein
MLKTPATERRGPATFVGRAEGEMSQGPPEERVIYRERFQARHFDFRGKMALTRFDRCEFVKCILLVDHGTEHLAFTECVFKDCNIDKLEQDEERGLYLRDNFFDRPLEERRAEFEKKLIEALATRKAKGK